MTGLLRLAGLGARLHRLRVADESLGPGDLGGATARTGPRPRRVISTTDDTVT